MNIDDWLLKRFREKPVTRDYYTKEKRAEYNRIYKLKKKTRNEQTK